ncbi:hypothetical protein ACFOVU_09320 [Nocardiopsis sediminis]|uniref:Alpha/beta hydrolase n=1 Tax=Nocardiopsis sediminis TaxID=1778267 RepID=A0ABV8FJ16_9ACTN
MAETVPEPPRPLLLVHGEADGYCDPATGLCAVPGTTDPEPIADADAADADGGAPGD